MDELAVLEEFRPPAAAPSYEAVRARVVETIERGRGGVGARLPRRALVLSGAAVTAALAVALPAFGLTGGLVDFFAAPPAPSAAQESFTSLDVGAPAGMAPGVSGPAHSVMQATVDGRTVQLWVAPTRAGGFCVLLENYGGGCDRDRMLPINIGLGTRTPASPVVLSGDVLSPDADHLELHYAGGDSISIPLVHVSPPIDAGFFVYVLPGATLQNGKWPTTVDAVGADGSIAGSTPFPTRCDPTPSGCASDPAGKG